MEYIIFLWYARKIDKKDLYKVITLPLHEDASSYGKLDTESTIN